LSLELISTPLISSNSFTTASFPFPAAHNSGVRRQLSLESMSASQVSSNSFTTASFPFLAAHNSGVRP
ncbi:hypothetical protein BGZ60DRAFT_388060, partial [Tricladium varicosporioides]